jgi:hypothetical protein
VALLSLAAGLLTGDRSVHSQDPKAAAPPREVSLFDGKTLKNWRVADTFEFEKHGKVEVRDGVLHLERGRTATGVTYTGKPPRSNYEISLEAQRTDGDDFFCGLTFPVGEEHCTLILGGWGGDVTGLSNVNAMSAEENTTTGYVDFKNGQWYKIRLRVTEETISAWVDKELILEQPREGRKFEVWWEQEPMRPLGIATWRTSAALRNVRLARLEER